MKNYIGFAKDYSSSMGGLRTAALKDYNATVTAVKDAASREVQDTIVYSVGFGSTVNRELINSNPHVLKPLDSWTANGNTAMYDAIGDLIEQFKAVPDYDRQDVSFLAFITTDGEENNSRKYNVTNLKRAIMELQNTGRFTFVLRVPRGASRQYLDLGIPQGNIQEWDTTTAGMEKSTVATTAAVDQFYAARSAGAKSTGVFYANATNVSVAAVKANLVDISAELSVWKVLPEEHKTEIATFAQKRLASPLLKGAAFYQLSKTEAKVADTKKIMIRDKLSGRVYVGDAARQMIGLPLSGTVRLKVGDHGNYDIFIQSTSTNRHVMANTEVLYHAKSGVPFKPEDQPWLQVTSGSIKASDIVGGITANKISVGTLKISDLAKVTYFATRELARASGKPVKDADELFAVKAPVGKRWFVNN